MITIKGVFHETAYQLKRLLFLLQTRKKQFRSIYRSGGFSHDAESVSGVGSELAHTVEVRKNLPVLLERYQIKSMIDGPCGDFNWIKHIDLDGINYLGIDIVDELIQKNVALYSSINISFRAMDIVVDALPKSDLFLCRDCFIHLTLSDAMKAIKNIKESGATWFLATSFPAVNSNKPLGKKFFRPINLQIPPFSFPPPVYSIDEKCIIDRGLYKDKILGLWLLSDLK